MILTSLAEKLIKISFGFQQKQSDHASTWDDILKLARENVGYVATYEQLLSNPTITLPAQSKEMKDAVELSRSLEVLRILREVVYSHLSASTSPPRFSDFSQKSHFQIAMHRVRPSPPIVEQSSTSGSYTAGASAGRGILFQWFPTWWGWSESNESPGNIISADGNESSVDQQIEGQILDALADTVDNNSLLRRDVVFCQINFTLKEGTFHLCSSGKDYGFEETPSEHEK